MKVDLHDSQHKTRVAECGNCTSTYLFFPSNFTYMYNKSFLLIFSWEIELDRGFRPTSGVIISRI